MWSHEQNLKNPNYFDPATMGCHHLHLVEDLGTIFSSPRQEYLVFLEECRTREEFLRSMYKLMRSLAISDNLAPSHEHGGGSSEL